MYEPMCNMRVVGDNVYVVPGQVGSQNKGTSSCSAANVAPVVTDYDVDNFYAAPRIHNWTDGLGLNSPSGA
jgi:hypothetical protein